ncbi:MAG: CRISPR-associated helicase/endonuclease Cas3 [Chloroflexi bacterium]|nr:MAG: CRISPR-associated helicase/endonuclease Cas3 [Chloroflexota bacterium]
MPLTSDQLLLIWAQSPRGSTGSTLYHPLLCHMLDVAMVAQALWAQVLTPYVQARIARGLGLPEDAASRWVAYLAGLHDIGKAAPVFQQKDPSCRERLGAAGLTWQPYPDDPGHGAISTHALRTLLPEEFGIARPVANALATAVGGHHGRFPEARLVNDVAGPLKAGDAPWADARLQLASTLAELLGVPRTHPPARVDHGTAMVLAGLVSVADWIGSDERYFPYARAEALDLPTYTAQALARAQTALDALHWTGWTPASAVLTFTDLFPDLPPRPVQIRVGEIPGVDAGPGIVIMELPMGEGKTEAAFALADRWGTALGQRGAYVAMPTMATSNQMFTRLRAFLERRYPDCTLNLQLLHSHAAIAPELESLRQADEPLLEPDNVHGDDERGRPAEVIAAAWFTRRKRGLLAPFGVGTVDQSLLAALQTRHVFVRLFGLAGKTIVFDEVHAYDTYMTTLFGRLLEWLGAVGSSVVILSATLPLARRDELLRSYAKGAGISLDGVPAAPYPRLTWLTPEGADAVHVETSAQARRTLHLEWVEGERAALGARLQVALAQGGCAAVICNTVGRAQATYLALKPFFAEHELSLLHARFPFEDRHRLETAALAQFGKPGGEQPSARPQRAVLVATQVIEQSLDLDFDLMVSDLAPADLVLQRSGRLWRHLRDRPPGFTKPTLWVVQPEAVEEGAPRFDRGSEYVYAPHVLLRSWLALQQRATLAIPEEVEALIEWVYGERAVPEEASERLRARWEETLATLQGDEEQERHEAQNRYLKPPSPKLTLAQIAPDLREEESPELHKAHQALTRLAPPSVPVVCLWKEDARISLDRAGTQPVDLSREPDLATAKLLLARSVGIADRRVVHTLLDSETPPGWQRSTLLQHARCLFFTPDGIARVGNAQIRLDPELGIIVEDALSGTGKEEQV